MRKKKFISHTITFASVAIVFAVIIFIVTYIKNIILPLKIKAAVIEILNKETGKITTIDNVYLIPFKGVVIKGLKVYDSTPEKEQTIFEAGEVNFNYLTLPLFRRKIIIPSINIKDLDVAIQNDPNTKEWNISTIKFFKKPKKAKPEEKYSVNIYKIRLSNGSLHITDNLAYLPFSKEVKNINAELTLLPIQARITIEATIKQKEKNSSLNLKGFYRYKSEKLILNVKAKELSPEEFKPYYVQTFPVEIQVLIDLTGDIVFTASEISTNNLKIYLKDDIILVKANIKDFKTPLLNIEVSSDLRLKNIEPVIRGFVSKELQKDFELDGRIELVLKIKDILNDSMEPEFFSTATLHNASIKTLPLVKEIKSIDGDFEIKNDFLVIKNLKLNFMDMYCSLDSVLKDFQNPQIDIKLDSDEFSLLSQFNITERNAHIEKTQISYKGSNASFIGDIYEINNPELNIYGNLDFRLEDIMPLISKKFYFLKDVAFNGNFKGELLLIGKLNAPRLMEIGLKLNSGEINVENLTAQNINIKAKTKNGKGELSNFSLEAYGGTSNIIATFDLEKDEIPYELSGHMRNVRLEQLIQKTKLKGSGVYGDFNGSVNLSGVGKDLDSIKGDGWIHVKDAHLGPLPILTPVMSYLVDFFHKIIPVYEKIMLKEATGTFTVANKKITTHDFILWGDEASVLYDGSVDFKGNLDFRVENNFSEGLIDNKTKMGKSLSAFISGVGRFIGEARLTGTIKAPRYEFKPLSLDRFFKERFKDIFQGIFR